MRVNEKFKQKLLLEGNDDQHVIWALCERFKIKESFDIIDCEGVDNLNLQIPIRFKQSGVKTIGIIVDADSDILGRYNSLKSILETEQFTLPNEIPENGLILKRNSIKIGIWLMPNNNLNGMLEDFIAFLVPKNDILLPLVNSTLSDLEKNKQNLYSLSHKSKAIIHTWLSWQEDPGTPMGLGITKRYLSTEIENCTKLISWLKNLFNEPQ
jgi:hypothetical protein